MFKNLTAVGVVMRIIAGEAKGRRLKTVPGMKVRPTTDRVRESLFQIIGPYFEGGGVLDLFAGSGSLGLETLSRGAERAVFVDQASASVETVRQNLQKVGFSDRAEVYRKDARAALRILVRLKIVLPVHISGPTLPGNVFAGTPDVYIRTRFIGTLWGPGGRTRSRLPA